MNKVCKKNNNLCLFSSLYTENLKYTQTRTYKLMLFLSSECCMSCHALCFWMNVCRAAVALHALAGCVAVLCSGRSFLDLLWLRFTWPLPQLPLLPDHMTTWLPLDYLGNVLLSVMNCFMTSVRLAVLFPLWSLLLPCTEVKRIHTLWIMTVSADITCSDDTDL